MKTIQISCLIAALAVASNATYSDEQAQISVWLSAEATCGKDSIMTHNFIGPAVGFVPTMTIYSGKIADTEGYIGYLPSDKSIYVIFRGSISLQNWLADFTTTKTDYKSWPECNCQVHQGFYISEQAVIADVITEVQRLKQMFPLFAVKTAGHSLGGALALLAQMDLIAAGYDVTMYNFGQPRVGDKAFAEFAYSKAPSSYRHTHYHDPVPRLPTNSFPLSFNHSCTEIYEQDSLVKGCSQNQCEDPTCADQWAAWQVNTDDHLTYLGHYMSCSSSNHLFFE